MFSTLPLFLLLLTTAHCRKDIPVFSPDVIEIIDEIHNACIQKYGISEEDLKNCEEKGIFKEDENFKCYMFCIFEEASLVDDGEVDYDMMVSLIPDPWQDKMREMLNICKKEDVPEKPRCQSAFDVHKCFHNFDPKFFFVL